MTIVVVGGTTVARLLVLVRGDVVMKVVVVDGFPMRGFAIEGMIEPELCQVSMYNKYLIFKILFKSRHTFHSVEGMKEEVVIG